MSPGRQGFGPGAAKSFDLGRERLVHVDEMLAVLGDAESRLSEVEHLFVEDMTRRVRRHGCNTMVSGKQLAWLERLWERER